MVSVTLSFLKYINLHAWNEVGSQGDKVSVKASGMQRNHKVPGCLGLKQCNSVFPPTGTLWCGTAG